MDADLPGRLLADERDVSGDLPGRCETPSG
jgi:hypothetical protein